MLPTESYNEQCSRWPQTGRHILAHHDEESIVVYQAYPPAIARHALRCGELGGPGFNRTRMSWIKPNFLWMMYRSGWGSKPGQEVVLGLRVGRGFFEHLLRSAVSAQFRPSPDGSGHAEWKADLARSEVRLQWDPDHDPRGGKLERRAIQLGLRGSMLERLASDEILEVIDMSPLIGEQLQYTVPSGWPTLRTPVESVYCPRDPKAALNVGLDAHVASQ